MSQDSICRRIDKKKEGRSRYTRAEVEKRPDCFYSDTPLDGTMCPQKMSCEVTLEPSAQSATIKVKVTLESEPLFSKTLYLAVIISVLGAKIYLQIKWLDLGDCNALCSSRHIYSQEPSYPVFD